MLISAVLQSVDNVFADWTVFTKSLFIACSITISSENWLLEIRFEFSLGLKPFAVFHFFQHYVD